jgi:hypothetical protein
LEIEGRGHLLCDIHLLSSQRVDGRSRRDGLCLGLEIVGRGHFLGFDFTAGHNDGIGTFILGIRHDDGFGAVGVIGGPLEGRFDGWDHLGSMEIVRGSGHGIDGW